MYGAEGEDLGAMEESKKGGKKGPKR